MKTIGFLILFFLFHTYVFAEPLNLVQLQQLALKENPRLKSLESEAQMAKHRITQSRSLEDPKLKFAVNSLPVNSLSFSEEDMTTKEIGISQMIPLWGKRSVREKITTTEYKKTLEEVRKEKIETLHQQRINVYALFAVRASRDIFNQMKSQLKLLIDSETALSKTGIGTLDGVISANIASITIDEELISLDQQEKEFLQKINYLTGSPVEVKAEEDKELVFRDVTPEGVKEELKKNSEMKISEYGQESSSQELELKKKEYYPDMELGASYMQRDDGTSGDRADMVSAMVSFNIPLWVKKKSAMVQEMENKGLSSEKALQDTMNSLNQKAESLLSQMKKWEEIHKLYSLRLIPQAELAFKSALANYRTSGGLPTVIEKMEMILKFKNELALAKKEYLTSYSELSALMGVEVLQ